MKSFSKMKNVELTFNSKGKKYKSKLSNVDHNELIAVLFHLNKGKLEVEPAD
jgi:c-di-GMP-binding flagellar brake protein YcgR